MNKPTISEKVVPPKIALLLKKKGFDWKISSFYEYTPKSEVSKGGYINHYRSYVAYSNTEWAESNKAYRDHVWKHYDIKHPNISAPTYDMVIDWLLEKGYYLYTVFSSQSQGWMNIYTELAAPFNNCGFPKYAKDRYKALDYGILDILSNKRYKF